MHRPALTRTPVSLALRSQLMWQSVMPLCGHHSSDHEERQCLRISSFKPPLKVERQPSQVVRHGDTVVRPAGPWTPAVHALLRHLERAGFAGSPRVVGDGYDDQGREVLTYIEGTFVHPRAWSDDGVWQVGRLLRDLHDATTGFQPPPDAVWRLWPFRSDAPGAVISHCDTGARVLPST
jgi:hypothetical protein